jgi:hypothetical protein
MAGRRGDAAQRSRAAWQPRGKLPSVPSARWQRGKLPRVTRRHSLSREGPLAGRPRGPLGNPWAGHRVTAPPRVPRWTARPRRHRRASLGEISISLSTPVTSRSRCHLDNAGADTGATTAALGWRWRGPALPSARWQRGKLQWVTPRHSLSREGPIAGRPRGHQSHPTPWQVDPAVTRATPWQVDSVLTSATRRLQRDEFLLALRGAGQRRHGHLRSRKDLAGRDLLKDPGAP